MLSFFFIADELTIIMSLEEFKSLRSCRDIQVLDRKVT